MNTEISIIIPAHHDNLLLSKLAGSLINQVRRPKEVIIVLDGLPGLVNMPVFPFPFIVVNSNGKGAAAARNTGAFIATGEYLLFLDSDVLAPPHFIQEAAKLVHDHDNYAAWTGSYEINTSQTNFSSQYKNLLNYFIHQETNTEASAFWSACGIIRKDVFNVVGGFDEECRMMEDIELGYKLKDAGFSIRLEKKFQVRHQKKWTFQKLIHSDIFDRAVPWTQLLHKYKQVANTDLNLHFKARISFVVLLLLVFLSPVLFIVNPVGGYAGVLTAIFLLLALNRRLYFFFYKQKGVFFLLRLSCFIGYIIFTADLPLSLLLPCITWEKERVKVFYSR